ncbi:MULTISPECIES: helix-turn-helix domain-containing protein [Micromonospora]|uniref:Helix-turn-helix domain-containing protein n=1 Tax=Micromonospora solifontis TaxID=2487138 RepID=A0ABX9WHU8_9ACTN|nr:MULTISPECIES: helix-turn-helix domain-containing protein [Micromonospora]NES13840.1 helix-turn-helix domain-containing protein [Micromonospora sp. PPF5-17B]NES37068.1 helix-turn-helix domain-containing protein [Micromonospora solifontis]NES58329.1 helix-turn-helix domain-containing protein [Micromonospora sp. PPF5-6]RNL98738.1 helix-turn-helix domain-containing protein [Micromonospora solifontis]
MPSHGPEVAMLVYSGAGSFDYVTVNEIFGVDYSARFGSWYRTRACGVVPGPVELDSGVTVQAEYGLDEAARADLLVVPGWTREHEVPPRALLTVLRRAYQRGARIMSICTGAFVLGHAGLLDHRRVTTHWALAPLLVSLFPAATVEPRALFIDDRRVLTAAGMSAGMDLALHVVRGDFGADAAATLARRLVLAGYRSGGQAQFVDSPLSPDPGDPLPDLLDYLRRHLDQRWSLDALGAQVHMSARTLARRFHRLTGMSPHQWLTRERILAAQRLLEAGDESVEQIAARTGLGSAGNLRHSFRRELGISPQAYRSTFRSRRAPERRDEQAAPSSSGR